MKVLIDGEEFDADPGRLTFGEQIQIKKVSGLKYGDFVTGIRTQDPEAMAAMFLVLKRRTNPGIRMADIEGLSWENITFVRDADDPAPAEGPAVAVPDPSEGETSKMPETTSAV